MSDAQVPARMVGSFAAPEGREPGAFRYYGVHSRERAGITFRCPCGCGAISALALRPCDLPPSWEGPGPDPVRPTLEPSVRQTQCGWHGYLRRGVWESV